MVEEKSVRKSRKQLRIEEELAEMVYMERDKEFNISLPGTVTDFFLPREEAMIFLWRTPFGKPEDAMMW